jgi:hypothetical protein
MAKQTLAAFQAAFSIEPVEVPVDKEFAKDCPFKVLWFRPLTSRQRDAFEASVVGIDSKRDLFNLRARLVFNCWVDDDGDKMGTPDSIGDTISAQFVGYLFDEVRRLNGMDKDDAVEEAGKD